MENRKEELLSDEEFFELFLADGREMPETAEERLLTEKIRQEIMESAEAEEAMLKEHPEAEQMAPSPDLFEKILAEANRRSAETSDTERTDTAYQPEEFLTEEDRKALEVGRKKMQKDKEIRRIHHWAWVAAVLVCVLVVSVSTEANRRKVVNVMSTLIGEDVLVRVNNETDREKVYNEQENAYADIETQLGIKPVRFMREIKEMAFYDYQIDEIAQVARLFYTYQDTIFSIIMRKNEDGTAKGSIKDGTIDEAFQVPTDIGTISVLNIDGTKGNKYMAEFVYDNVYYHILGEMPKKEFTKLLTSIFF